MSKIIGFNQNNWKKLIKPTHDWVSSMERILCRENLPKLEGQTLYILSDYSG